MSDTSPQPSALSSGVEHLLSRLREDGVEAGRQEAAELLRQARAEAEALHEQERAALEQRTRSAKEEIDRDRRAAEAALQQAARDALLDLENRIVDLLATRLHQAVTAAVDDPAFLQQLVRDGVASATAPLEGADAVTVEVPSNLGEQAQALFGDLIGDGFSLAVGDHPEGLRFRLDRRDQRIECTPGVLAELMLSQLTPGFREHLRGHLTP